MLFDEPLDLFCANANDQRPYCTVNNNLLMLKLIKKEEKRITNQRFHKHGPRETILTDSVLLRAVLPPSADHRYTTFAETIRALTGGARKSAAIVSQPLSSDEAVANKAAGSLLRSSMITVEDGFSEIRKRDRSDSLSHMDVDEATTQEQAKIVQLAGLASTKKGVQLF